MPFQHTEAFCLMIYRTETTSDCEIVWNSRDGVTPSLAVSRDDHGMAHDEKFGRDRCEPGFVPAVGTRAFVDLTRDALAGCIRQRINPYIDSETGVVVGGLAQRFREKTADEIVDIMTKSEFDKNPHQPHLVIVTPELFETFRRTIPERLEIAKAAGWVSGGSR